MMSHRAALTCSLLLLALACCGDDGAPALDTDAGAQVADGGLGDAGAGDASGALTEEVEPNNGNTPTEVNMVSLPVTNTGAIGTTNDIDIFAVNLTAGELLRWTITANDQNYAPHLAISEATNMRPVTLAFGAPGASESFHHFAMKTGLHYLIVRDARNVPAEMSENIGGGIVRYALQSSAPTIAATSVTIPSRTSHTLPGVFELGYFSFTLAQSTDLKIEVFAQRKVPASDMDSRLSLFSVTGDEWLITNDNPALDQPDSVVTGVLPAGEYRVVVDNVDPEAADLAFELDLSAQ